MHSFMKSVIAFSIGSVMWTISNTSISANKINDYLVNKNLPHAEVTNQIWTVAKKPNDEKPHAKIGNGYSGFPTYNYNYADNAGKPKMVIVHETANDSDNGAITSELNYMKNNYGDAFVHTFVSGEHIINIANTDYLAWGAGYYGNLNAVQFEQVRVNSKSGFAKEIGNAAYYTAYVLQKYGLKPSAANTTKETGTVWSHHNVSTAWLGSTDHTDPDGYWEDRASRYWETTYKMSDFLTLVKRYYENLPGWSTGSPYVSGPYSYNKAEVYEDGNYTAWSNFRFSAKKAKLNVGKVYTAKYLYKHDNGSQYVSLYDGSTWVGYVNITGIAQQAVRSMKDVTITKPYTLWQNLAFSSKKGMATVGKQYRAKYIYVHGNGHTYLSLYDLKTGVWVGYFDATGAKTVNGGSVNATGPSTYNHTMLYEKPYTAWDNLNFGVKQSALSIGKVYTAKYTYQHTNGSTYVSLYDGSQWAGYVEIGGLTQSGIAIDKIVTIRSAYTLWGNLAFNAIKGKATIGNQYRAKVIYVHGNGHTYYSLYDVKTGKWIGYFDATGLK